jgi:hypothetical protein
MEKIETKLKHTGEVVILYDHKIEDKSKVINLLIDKVNELIEEVEKLKIKRLR